jgi:hypothetical protein
MTYEVLNLVANVIKIFILHQEKIKKSNKFLGSAEVLGFLLFYLIPNIKRLKKYHPK